MKGFAILVMAVVLVLAAMEPANAGGFFNNQHQIMPQAPSRRSIQEQMRPQFRPQAQPQRPMQQVRPPASRRQSNPAAQNNNPAQSQAESQAQNQQQQLLNNIRMTQVTNVTVPRGSGGGGGRAFLGGFLGSFAANMLFGAYNANGMFIGNAYVSQAGYLPALSPGCYYWFPNQPACATPPATPAQQESSHVSVNIAGSGNNVQIGEKNAGIATTCVSPPPRVAPRPRPLPPPKPMRCVSSPSDTYKIEYQRQLDRLRARDAAINQARKDVAGYR